MSSLFNIPSEIVELFLEISHCLKNIESGAKDFNNEGNYP